MEKSGKKKLVEYSCADFAALLSSKAPVPGGGGAAALTGALGAALCAMAGSLTLGKPKYAAFEGDLRRMLEDAEGIRRRLLELVDEDAAAFAPLAEAYSLPKDDPERAKVLERASLCACEAPLAMMRQIGRAIELLSEMLEKGSALLLSDVGCGALLCKAALESASLNVFVNTASLPKEMARPLEEEAEGLLETYAPIARRVAEEVFRRVRKEE